MGLDQWINPHQFDKLKKCKHYSPSKADPKIIQKRLIVGYCDIVQTNIVERYCEHNCPLLHPFGIDDDIFNLEKN